MLGLAGCPLGRPLGCPDGLPEGWLDGRDDGCLTVKYWVESSAGR